MQAQDTRPAAWPPRRNGGPHYTVDPETGCWNWCRTRRDDGYAVVRVGNRTLRAHRLSYEFYVGSIPSGLFLDHLCRNRGCVNPDHLEAVTNATNCRRGVMAKMTWERVRDARAKALEAGEPLHVVSHRLAPAYGIHHDTMRQILCNVAWHDPAYTGLAPLWPRKN